MAKITNTRTQSQLAGGLLGVVMAMPGNIEASEAQGQRELINSSQLPVKMPPADKVALEKLGVKFLKKSDRDSLFWDVELPKGWKVKAGGSSYWSELIDETGKTVGSMFYKAAFYDREAFFNLKA